MQEGSKVKFFDCSDGDVIFGDGTIFVVTRSGDILHTISPDACVMEVKWTHPSLNKWKPGDITVDYFGYDFTYLGQEENLESIIKSIEESIVV